MEANTSVEQIVSDIKSSILNGKYKSHDKLSERVLCEQFNVSRTPIRQALLLMKEEGWLYSKSNSGTYVSPVDRNDVIENYKARMSLEPVVLEMAFPNITKEDIAKMRRILELVTTCPADHYYDNEHRLHMIYVNRANNRYISLFFESMLFTMRRLAVLSSSIPSRISQSIEEWTEIVNALDAGDPQTAARWLSRHMLNSYLNFLHNNPE